MFQLAQSIRQMILGSESTIHINFSLILNHCVQGKVMFLGASVCSQGGRADSPSLGRLTLFRQAPPCRQGRCGGHWSGRYLSYWNAFLFLTNISNSHYTFFLVLIYIGIDHTLISKTEIFIVLVLCCTILPAWWG